MKKKFAGEGAERVAYFMTEIDENNQPVGYPMIAKDSKRYSDNQAFHKACGMT